jgi:hypothetical protein
VTRMPAGCDSDLHSTGRQSGRRPGKSTARRRRALIVCAHTHALTPMLKCSDIYSLCVRTRTHARPCHKLSGRRRGIWRRPAQHHVRLQQIMCGYSRLRAATADYVRLQQIMCGYSRLRAATADYVRLQQITCGYSRLCAATADHVRLQQIMCGYSRSCAATADHVRLQQIMCGYSRLRAATADYVRLQQIMCGYSGSCAATADHVRLQHKTNRDLMIEIDRDMMMD